MKLTKPLIAIGLIVLAVLLGVFAANQLGIIGFGSGWEFDYAIQRVNVNGEGYAIDTTDDTSPPIFTEVDDTFEGGGGGGANWLLDIVSHDAYNWLIDPDGDPVFNQFLNVYSGLAPNVNFQMSQVWRLDKDRNELASNAPAEDSLEVGDELWSKYYYAFSVQIKTISRPFTARNGINVQFTTAEAGSLTCDLVIQVRLQETIFGEVTGEFMDATVIAAETNIHELLATESQFAIMPDAEPSDVNSAIEIRDRTEAENLYYCTMHIPAFLQCGLTRIDPWNYVPANVEISYVILTTLLLKEPLVIGDQGGPIIGEPPYNRPQIDWELIIFIAVVVVVVSLSAFFIWVRFRKR